MNLVFLSLGSNQNDRISYLQKAIRAIEDQIGKVELISSFYETEPWGFYSASNFINLVICLKTTLPPEQLLENILIIEKTLGRKRLGNKLTYENRTIDIDILFYNDLIYNSPNLSIPHKFIESRRFILKPLCEISSDFIHPVLKLSIGELLLKCPDKLKVEKYIVSELFI